MFFMYKEPFIQERIAAAQERVERILYQQDYADMDDFLLALRVIVSRAYKIPVFSDYFESLTLDQLLFEVEIVNSLNTSSADRTTKIVNDNKEELGEMFDDFDEAEASTAPGETEFDQLSKDFMNNDKFVGE